MNKKKILMLTLTVLVLMSGCLPATDGDSAKSTDSEELVSAGESQVLPAESSDECKTAEQVEVCFFDVGQGDCILISTPAGKHILIDSGTLESKDKVMGFLSNKGVKEIEYAFFTHPHADHIGAADEIINRLDVKNVYMPDAAATTMVFERLLEALESKESVNVVKAHAGKIIELDSLIFEILSPIKNDYYELNQFSIVIKMTHGENVFLFMGDATTENEEEMQNAGMELDADIIKVGHHGSAGSTSVDFLDAVTPKIAVISVGANNDYSHPADSIIEKLNDIKTYRTDIDGTIIVYSGGIHSLEVSSIKPDFSD